MASNTAQKLQVQPKNLLLPHLLLWHLFIIIITILFFVSPAFAAFSDTPTAWDNFTDPPTDHLGYKTPYTYLGQTIADHTEGTNDPSRNGPGVEPDTLDLASGSPDSNPGPYDTPSYGYYDGGTPYDPLVPSTLDDDYLLFRLRVTTDPNHSVGFDSNHWNILVDVDDDGYKEFWVDLQGSYNSNSNPDRLRILYNNDNSQLVGTADQGDEDLVDEFYAYNDAASNPSSFTRSFEATTDGLPGGTPDGTGDWWIEIQVPMTAFKDENGNQVLSPDSPVGFVFSTSASNSDPLQKDFMMDLDFISSADPITFGDIVIISGDPKIEFVDSDLKEISFYEEESDVYTYVKHPLANQDPFVLETITITVNNPATDDDEQLTLCESSPNSGLFTNKGGAQIESMGDSDNGWISSVTTSSATDGFDWEVRYDLTNDVWRVYKSDGSAPTPNWTEQSATATAGTEYSSDNNEITFIVYQISPADGDTIEISTCAADPLPWETDNGVPHDKNDNGSLEFSGGNTVQFSYTYTDSSNATQTLTTSTPIVGIGEPFIEFTRSTGLPSNNFELKDDSSTSDKLYVTVTHPDSNTNSGVAETIQVTLNNDPDTGDSQTLTLTETGPDTGIFRNTTGLDTQVSDGIETADDGLWEDSDGGIVKATFNYDPPGPDPAVDYTTTANLFYIDGAGRVSFTNSAGTEDVELYKDNDRAYIKVEDFDLAGNGTVDVDLTSPTGDSLTVTLTETTAGSGIFINNAVGDPAITIATYDGAYDDTDNVIEIVHDTTITVSYTDADDGDVDATNNNKTDTASYFDPPIVINEVFFYPTPDAPGTYDGQTEYFQVYNSSSSNVDIAGYTITDGDGFTYTFPEDPSGVTPGQLILEPGEYAYVFLYSTFNNDPATYDTQIGNTFYLFTDVTDTPAGSPPADELGDPGHTSPNRSDQLTLKDASGVTQDYVAWSSESSQSIDFLSDDSAAVSQGIWDENDFRDVETGTPIPQGSSIKRVSDGYDTDDPSDWVYSDTTSLWDPDLNLLTPVGISSFKAFGVKGSVMLRWETSFESGTVGFYIFRKTSDQFMYHLVNRRLVPALIGNPQGGTYQYHDRTAVPGVTYSYLLEEVVETGERLEYGPYTVKALRSDQENISSAELIRSIRRAPAFAWKRKDLRRNWKSFQFDLQGRKPFANRDYSGPKSLKISISEPGLYHISARDIAQQLDMPYRSTLMLLNKHGFKLSNRGQSIPYFINRNDPGINFYGFEHSNIYSEENVFWLSLGWGKRMRYISSRKPRRTDKVQSFIDTVSFEENMIPITSQPWENTDDYWIWQYSFSGFPGLDLMTFAFQLNDVVPTEDQASLSLHLVGGSIDGDIGIGDHLAEVSINGSKVGECTWKGIDLHTCTLFFSQELLQNGENILDVQGRLIHGGGFSLFYVDSFDIAYRRYYKSVDNAIEFSIHGKSSVSIGGFDSRNIYLLDISNKYRPRLAIRTKVSRDKNTYRLSFSPKSARSRYMAVAAPAFKSVDGISAYSSSGLKKRNNWADYLIITPAELKDSVQELADYRSGQGHAVKIVELDQIINEFNDGLYSPMAIKQFLAYAHSEWRRAPQFVILVGDANYDYRDVQGFGGNLVPTVFVSSPNGLFASDNYLADVDDDGIPEMAIGRLPVLSGEELQHIVAKIKIYESSSGNWKDKLLLLADESDGYIKFAWDSERLSHLIPPEYSLEKVYLSDNPIESARQKLFDKLELGAAFANYIGHGGTDRIASNGLLVSDDVEYLTSAGRAPVVTAMTCAVGEFTFPNFDTLAELLVLQPDGGATAVWSASGLSINSEARHLDREFYKAIYSGEFQELGKAILKSFQEYSLTGDEPYHLLIYNLLGDPALKIR
jgi:hypothetical protein